MRRLLISSAIGLGVLITATTATGPTIATGTIITATTGTGPIIITAGITID